MIPADDSKQRCIIISIRIWPSVNDDTMSHLRKGVATMGSQHRGVLESVIFELLDDM